MTTIRIIGDVHGKFRSYRDVIRDVPRSIQVGDMGVGFKRNNGDFEWCASPPYDSMSRGDHKFIRGNHDNPQGGDKSFGLWLLAFFAISGALIQ